MRSFTSLQELNHEIKLLGKGFSKTMWFAKEGMAATEVLIGKRGDENAVSQRGRHIRVLQTRFPVDVKMLKIV